MSTPRVLLVEDNVALAENVAEILEDQGMVVVHAPSAARALAKAAAGASPRSIAASWCRGSGNDIGSAFRPLARGRGVGPHFVAGGMACMRSTIICIIDCIISMRFSII